MSKPELSAKHLAEFALETDDERRQLDEFNAMLEVTAHAVAWSFTGEIDPPTTEQVLSLFDAMNQSDQHQNRDMAYAIVNALDALGYGVFKYDEPS